MSADEPGDREEGSGNEGNADGETGAGDPSSDTPVDEGASDEAAADVRERIEEGADRAAQQIDESVVDLLAWILDTETRARIYVELRQHPDSTSEEIADGTGLYPSTVREALAELHEEGKLDRRKRESDGAGNNPYEYRAMAPTDLVRDVIGDVQAELNTVFNLDRYLGGEESEQTPVKINVEEDENADRTDADVVEERRTEAGADADDTEMVDATDGDDSDHADGGHNDDGDSDDATDRDAGEETDADA